MIDQARLEELVNDFGEEDLAEIIEVFLDETWEAINALEAVIGAMTADEQRERFHFLKGCARNIGALTFGDICEKWEQDSAPFTAAGYASLRGAFQQVCDDLMGRGLRLSA